MKLLDWLSGSPAAADFERKDPTLGAVPMPQNNGGGLENPNVPITAEQLAILLGGGPTAAGIPVGEKSAMRSTAVFACVSLVSGVIAGLPLHVYQKTPKGRQLADTHALYPLLHDCPNPDTALTSFIWRELIGVHLQLAGNHYSAIESNGAGDIVGVVPLHPWQVEVRAIREGLGQRRLYRVTLSDGSVYDLRQEEVLHVPGLGFDGLKGISPIQMAGREPVGASLAMEESAARILANGARNSGVVTKPAGKALSPDALRLMKEEFRGLYQGSHNAGEVLFLDNGMTWTAMQMSLKDAELLQSRKYSVADIARIFGVPPFLIGETADMTAWGSGLEQIMLAFLMLNLERWLRRIEAEFRLKLFGGTDFYPRFDRDALQATNAAGRAEFFSKMFGCGMTLNEIRRKQDLDDKDGGDEPMVPVNYQPLSKALAAAPKAPTPAPAP